MRVWVHVVLIGMACSCVLSVGQGANLIPNGGFEVDEDGDGMADGWQFSGNASVRVKWSLDTGIEGRYSQRLECTAFEYTSPASHVMLALNDGFGLREGQWYRLTFQVKGEGVEGGIATVAIQQTGPWENLGLNKEFRLGSDWQEVEATFRATKTIMKNLRLQIWFTSTGTMWIDDVRMVETEPQARRCGEVVADWGTKNLLPNASFECGTSGWGSITDVPGWGGNLNSLLGEVKPEGRHHRHSFQIEVDRKTAPVYYFDYFEMIRQLVLRPLVANRGWVSVEPGMDYTLSADVRAQPVVPCLLRVYQAFGESLERRFEASEEWQRVSFTFKPTRDQVFVAVGPDLQESELAKATLWVDGVQLEKGTLPTTFEPRADVEVGLEWEEPGHLFAAGEEARAVLVAFNSGRETQSLRLIVAVTDFADTRVLSKNVEVTVPAGATIRQKLELGTGKRGFFRVTLECEEGAVIPSRAERFAVIERCTDSDGLFGMNHAYPWATLNALSKKIGLTWFRDWSLKWLHVEPEPGQFDFTETDYQINRVLELGINVLPLLPFPSNNWASTAPLDVGTQGGYPSNRERAAYMPRDLTEFANYVRTTVTRYRDRLHVWEILNEPIYTSYALPASKGYTVRDYVQLLEVAYRAIKETDPQAVVIGGIAGPPGHFTKDFIDAGGLKWVDALNLHAYPGLHTPEGYVKELRKLIEQMKAAEGVRPIWLTEGAYYADDDPPWEPYTFSWMTLVDNEALCAAYQVRFDALLLAHGTQKIIYHSGTSGSLNREAVEGIFFEWDGAPRKMAATQAQLTALLGPNTKPLGVLSEEPWICAFHSRGKTVAIIWDTSPGNRHLAPLKGAQLLDLCGNPVTESVPLGETPYYVVFDREVSRDYVQRALL